MSTGQFSRIPQDKLIKHGRITRGRKFLDASRQNPAREVVLLRKGPMPGMPGTVKTGAAVIRESEVRTILRAT